MLKIKSADSCKYDILSLGEIMLRFDPGPGRIHTARQFAVWEGDGARLMHFISGRLHRFVCLPHQWHSLILSHPHPLGGPRRVGGLLGVAGRLSGTVSPFTSRGPSPLP